MENIQTDAFFGQTNAFMAALRGGDAKAAEAIAQGLDDSLEKYHLLALCRVSQGDYRGAIDALSHPECDTDEMCQRVRVLAALRAGGVEEARLQLNRALENGIGIDLFMDIYADLLAALGRAGRASAARFMATGLREDRLALVELLIAHRAESDANALFTALPEDARKSERGIANEFSLLLLKGDTSGAKRVLRDNEALLRESEPLDAMLQTALRAYEGEDIDRETEEDKALFAPLRIPSLLTRAQWAQAAAEADEFFRQPQTHASGIAIIQALIAHKQFACAQRCIACVTPPPEGSDAAYSLRYASLQCEAGMKGDKAAREARMRFIADTRAEYIRHPERTALCVLRVGCLRDLGMQKDALALAQFLCAAYPERDDLKRLIQTLDERKE